MDNIQTKLFFQSVIQKESNEYEEVSYKFEDIDFHEVESTKLPILVKVGLILNNKEYSPQDYDMDIYSLLFKNLNSKTWYDLIDNTVSDASDFYPFSCSCGEPGCAGIWNGIRIKPRKHTIEWRASLQDGYKFLDKHFFSFDRQQYQKELVSLSQKIYDLEQMLGRKVFIDYHYHLGLITIDEVIKNYNKHELRLEKRKRMKKKLKLKYIY